MIAGHRKPTATAGACHLTGPVVTVRPGPRAGAAEPPNTATPWGDPARRVRVVAVQGGFSNTRLALVCVACGIVGGVRRHDRSPRLVADRLLPTPAGSGAASVGVRVQRVDQGGERLGHRRCQHDTRPATTASESWLVSHFKTAGPTLSHQRGAQTSGGPPARPFFHSVGPQRGAPTLVLRGERMGACEPVKSRQHACPLWTQQQQCNHAARFKIQKSNAPRTHRGSLARQARA